MAPSPATRSTALDRRLCVAPMMDWTDRHCRVLHRRLAPRALLYTEMVHACAVLRGDRARLLGHADEEHPLALQLGGSDPAQLAQAARIGVEHGFDEVNLNCGCPSERVQDGAFGACLMREPDRVADAVAAMRDAVAGRVPVTVKCRIGVDDQDAEADLTRFIDAVAAAGCTVFIVHARKAWLQGLSPKENREIPPLDHERVVRLKAARPQLAIVLNGGIADAATADAALRRVDGVMLGRAAYHTPWLLAQLHAQWFGTGPADAITVLAGLQPYVEARLAAGDPLAAIVRHWLGLPAGRPGARAFRRVLTEQSRRPGAGWDVVERAIAQLGPALAAAA